MAGKGDKDSRCSNYKQRRENYDSIDWTKKKTTPCQHVSKSDTPPRHGSS